MLLLSSVRSLLKANIIRNLFHVALVVLTLTIPEGVLANTPLTSTPVGDGPVKIAVSPDGQIAAVVKLFPKNDDDPNLEIVEIASGTGIGSYRVGRRMIDTTIVSLSDMPTLGESGWAGLFVFGDLDYARLVKLNGGLVLQDFPAGSRPAAITSWNPSSNAGFFVVTNGSSSNLTVTNMFDLQPRGTISTGIDPRDTAIHPAGRYGYVAVGGQDRVDVVDFQTLQRIRSVAVGSDPVAVEVAADGSVAVVANLTSNTISVLDLSNPAHPTVRVNSKGQLQLPVGVQPSAIAVTSDGRTAYVANTGSAYVTVVDLDTVQVTGVIKVQAGTALASAISAIALTPDDTRLLMTERGNGSRLLIYDTAQLVLEPAPIIDIPGEPAIDLYLRTDEGYACPGYYTASVALMEGAQEGFYGTEILATLDPQIAPRLFQGGLNIGGAFTANGGAPSYAAFNIANRNNEQQRVTINVNATALPTPGFNAANLGLKVELIGPGNVVLGSVSGTPPLVLEKVVGIGFHRARVSSLTGSPRGTFTMSLATSFVDRAGGGFQGGVNIGGLLVRRPNGQSVIGYAGFCISNAQIMKLRTEGQISRGPTGAGAMVLTVKDRNQAVVKTVSNIVPPSPQVIMPDNSFLQGVVPSLYVDDDAPDGGNGSLLMPFNSITKAVGQAAVSGDVIFVAPGTYSPSLTGEVLPIGGPGIGLSKIPQGVSLFGAGAGLTTIDAENTKVGGNNVNAVVIGSDGVRVAGFTVRNSSAVGIYVYNGNQVSVDHNFLTGNARFGIGSSQAHGIVVYNNAVVANVESGIAVSGSALTDVSGAPHPIPSGCPGSFGACVIRNTTNDHRADGILASQGGDYAILENTCINNGVSGIELNNREQPGGGSYPPLSGIVNNNLTSGNGGVQFAFAGTGILITEFAEAREIRGNTIVNNRPGGLAIFEDATAGVISNNTIIDSAQNGLAIQKRSSAVTISNNTISNNSLAGLFVSDHSTVGSATNNNISDNGACLACSSSKGGVSVTGNSTISLLKDNTVDGNANGFELNNGSQVTSMEGNYFDNSIIYGGLIRTNSDVVSMTGGRVSNALGATGAGLRVSASHTAISGVDFTGNTGQGITAVLNSVLSISNLNVSTNGSDGVKVDTGTNASLANISITGNGGNGVLATGGSTVSVTGSFVDGNGKRGLNASGGASITCISGNFIGANGTGATFGSVTGC